MRPLNMPLTLHSAMFLLCLSYGILIVHTDIWLTVGLFLFGSMLVLICARPDFATLMVIFIFYINLPVVATKFHGVPPLMSSSILLLLVVPLIHYLFIEQERLVFDQTFLLMLVFLIVLLVSSLFAKDYQIALAWIITYVQEGLLIYFLVINVIRSLTTLKRVIWVLLLACSLMATLSLYQTLTQSYENHFGGLAQRKLAEDEFGRREKKRTAVVPGQQQKRSEKRAMGPIGGPNRFAQVLLVILPLALYQLWAKRTRSIRMCAATTALLILSGVLLTYSRGAFVTLLLMLLVLMFMRYIKPLQLIITLSALILLVVVAAPDYYARIDSIRGVQGLASDEAAVDPDGATRGRVTEMLSAMLVFLDYPILGVGPGQYMPFYSVEYQLNPDISFRHLPTQRRAHTIFETAAETGLLGFTLFLAIAFLIMRRLWHNRRRLANSRPDLANIATAFLLSMIAYGGTAIFLHLAYQRYYWLLLAVIGAALRIIEAEPQTPNDQEGAALGTAPATLHQVGASS